MILLFIVIFYLLITAILYLIAGTFALFGSESIGIRVNHFFWYGIAKDETGTLIICLLPPLAVWVKNNTTP